jgi:hypothetical protein
MASAGAVALPEPDRRFEAIEERCGAVLDSK